MKVIKFRKLGNILAMTLPFGYMLVREDIVGDSVVINHERIHLAQIKRDGTLKFYAKYFWEAINKGYRNISYEIEAYENERDFEYLK
jgi:hypothetical protein